MSQRCRLHLKRQAINEWLDDDGPDQTVFTPWFDPVDLLPGSYEELAAWGLGLEVADLPGWGTELDLEGLCIFTA